MRTSQPLLFIVTAGLLLVIMSACQTDNQQQKQRAYGYDGYMGISNSNPNLHTSPSYHTYSDDTRMIYRALQSVPGAGRAQIRLNGPHAYVTIRVPPSTPPEEKQRIQTEAESAVSMMMPRYQVKVTVK